RRGRCARVCDTASPTATLSTSPARSTRGSTRRSPPATPTSPERRRSSTSRTTRPGCASTSDPPTTCRSTVRELGLLGLGTAPLGGLYDAVGDDTAHAVVARAWEQGIRYFDTAPYYGSGLAEERLGAALRGRPRHEYVVSTKVGRLLRPGKSE